MAFDPPKTVVMRAYVEQNKFPIFLDADDAIAAPQVHFPAIPDAIFPLPGEPELVAVSSSYLAAQDHDERISLSRGHCGVPAPGSKFLKGAIKQGIAIELSDRLSVLGHFLTFPLCYFSTAIPACIPPCDIYIIYQ
jgi:hypothetical protein